jgi:integrating conjugative element protein (TIGR03752 family)
VPRNATLIGSTAMTALVGRVPIQGQVRDPMPFKVITGAENLAANGLRLPGVQGMVWSGTAVVCRAMTDSRLTLFRTHGLTVQTRYRMNHSRSRLM